MLRIFLPLWIIVITLLVATLTIDFYNPVTAFQQKMGTNYLQSTFKGTFYLLKQGLAKRPEIEWGQYMEEISPSFGYKVMLSTLDELKDEIGEVPKIGTEIPTVILTDSDAETDYMSIRVGSQGRILTLFLSQTEEEDSIRTAQGTLFLLDQILDKLPFEEWSEKVKELQNHFGFGIELLPMDRLSLNNTLKEKLETNRVAWELTEDDQEFFYNYYPEHEHVLKAGPVQFLQQGTVLAGVFSTIAAIIGFGVYLGLRPVWRDLSRIDKAATAFGKGELDSRVKIPKHSGLSRLGNSFNGMAGGIEKLINSHRDLTNAVSHDLRTPLARLKFAVEMLEEEDDPEVRQRYQRTIKNSVGSLEHLINELLVHSRFMRTPNMTHFSNENLYELLSTEVELCDEMADSIHIHLNVSDIIKTRPINIDKNALTRALNNLLSNAMRYAKSEILLEVSIEKKQVRLSVMDDGVGIPEDERKNVFQPFTQLDNAARDSNARHGLGLAIVQQIAQWHKGEVTVTKSRLGGAEFIITWPL